MAAGDTTQPSFPTYADLTQTSGWAKDATAQVALDDTMEVAVGDRRYTEGSVLGMGGMGTVLLAHDARIGREVAVKQLRGDRELGPDERARFLREARVQGQLEHPSIVPVYDIDQRSDGSTFFTMRRVLGRTLHAIVEDLRAGDPAARARYTQRELLTAFATICLTIDYAHSRGVIHRDLKPANVMLGDFGEVYVLDWGLARLVHEERAVSVEEPASRLSVPGEMMGTPLYMAPEQMADPAVGPAADVFALGAMLFEILTLERLRDATTIYLPAEARPSVRVPDRGVAPELETICVRATATDPADRYPSARALQEAVVRFLEGDRELAQRRQLATAHVTAAREALARAELPEGDGERERGVAMRELRNAVALEPTNGEAVAALGQLLATPPTTIPPEVHAQLRSETNRVVRSGAAHSVVGMASWFVFLPVLFVLGIRDYLQLAVILVPALISALASAYALRQPVIARWTQYVTIGGMLIGAMAASRLYGPLVLVPTLIASYVIVLQAHPARRFRRLALVAGVVAMIVPLLLELAGVLPSSYAFEGGRWLIEPQLVALPRTGTLVMIAAANIAMIVVPSVFIARLRSELSEIQARQLLQAWHFRRLGDQLTTT